MINASPILIDEVFKAVHTKYPQMKVRDDLSEEPKSFPCVYVDIDDSKNSKGKRISTRASTFDSITCSIYVYSDLAKGRLAQCVDITTLIDDRFRLLGLTRTGQKRIDLSDPNNRAIKLIRSTYDAEIDADVYFYNRM